MELSVSLLGPASQAIHIVNTGGVFRQSCVLSVSKEHIGPRCLGSLPICPFSCHIIPRRGPCRAFEKDVVVDHTMGTQSFGAFGVNGGEIHNSMLLAKFNPLPARRHCAPAISRKCLKGSFYSFTTIIESWQSATKSCESAAVYNGLAVPKALTGQFFCCKSIVHPYDGVPWGLLEGHHFARPCRARHQGGRRWAISAGLKLDDDVSGEAIVPEEVEEAAVGEDAGVFDLEAQSLKSWGLFTAILATVLAITYYVWIDSGVGFGYGSRFIQTMSLVSDNHEVVMLAILFVFAVVHSGLAGLRSSGEKLIGERAYRVLFASASLPLSIAAVVYFINHRYDGVQLWQLRTVPGVHELVWLLSFVSFFFLYPSTFNLLEVAAVDRPKLHLWDTGIIRITRHPQMVGQLIWCLAHTLWIGNSFTLTASVGLCAHHLFGCWHGDRRLAERYGEEFESIKARTSIVPFAAILDGRQKLPKEYWHEFLRAPYFTITALTLGAYFCHPLMQIASFHLHW